MNPSRLARVRSLIEQLDTPGRAGGNIFIIYLKNAEATRVAQTLRALLAGGSDTGAAQGASLAPAPSLSAAPAVPASLEWSKVKITLASANPQKGALPPGFTASIEGRILNAGEENSVDKEMGPDGVVDFGWIRVGSHQLIVVAPWGEHCKRRLEVQPAGGLSHRNQARAEISFH